MSSSNATTQPERVTNELSSSNATTQPERVTNEPPVFFFGPFNANGFLSNLYISLITERGVVYNCVEQYFQAKKAELFGDEKRRLAIMKERDPKKQKVLGRKVKSFDKVVWSENSRAIMKRAIYLKFTNALEVPLRRQLIDTGSRDIAEVSGKKGIAWGAGLGLSAAEEKVRSGKWKGTPVGLLGELLMELRSQLRAAVPQDMEDEDMDDEDMNDNDEDTDF